MTKEKIGLIFIGAIIVLIIVVGVRQRVSNKRKIEQLNDNDNDNKYSIVYVSRNSIWEGIHIILETVDYDFLVWKYKDNYFYYYIPAGTHHFNVRIEKSPLNPFNKKIILRNYDFNN